MLQVATDDAAAAVIRQLISEFSSPKAPLSGSHPLDLSGLGYPTGSNDTASLAFRVTRTQKSFHHSKGMKVKEWNGMQVQKGSNANHI